MIHTSEIIVQNTISEIYTTLLIYTSTIFFLSFLPLNSSILNFSALLLKYSANI